jgi:BioD-like phosphotransacetylase family protein
MRSLYIAATEASAGKTTLALGLCAAFRARGLDAGYFKPVGSAVEGPAGEPDEDTVFVAQALDLSEDPLDLCPLVLGDGSLTTRRPTDADPRKVLREVYSRVAAEHDLLICEGVGELWQGRFLRISGADVIALLDLPSLLVARFTGPRLLDDICYVHDFIKSRLLGVVFTMVPETRLDAVMHRFAQFLDENCAPSFGVVPVEPKLASVRVGDIAVELNGRFLAGESSADRLAESYLIGAMSAEHALGYFERTPNKVVVVGGDRDDLILAALKTSTAGLVLTGGLTPGTAVIDAAVDAGVALISVPHDTVHAADGLRRVFGRLSFQDRTKIDLGRRLLADHVDIDRLVAELT